MKQFTILVLFLVLIAVVVAFGMVRKVEAATLVLEAEVLEGSGSLDPAGAQAGPVRYALIHHARSCWQATDYSPHAFLPCEYGNFAWSSTLVTAKGCLKLSSSPQRLFLGGR